MDQIFHSFWNVFPYIHIRYTFRCHFLRHELFLFPAYICTSDKCPTTSTPKMNLLILLLFQGSRMASGLVCYSLIHVYMCDNYQPHGSEKTRLPHSCLFQIIIIISYSTVRLQTIIPGLNIVSPEYPSVISQYTMLIPVQVYVFCMIQDKRISFKILPFSLPLSLWLTCMNTIGLPISST